VAHGQDLDDARYRVSSYSGGGNCVAVDLARSDALVAVRHSRRRDEPPLLFNRAEWTAFVAGVKNHEFDLD
jgi:hypothetical protein